MSIVISDKTAERLIRLLHTKDIEPPDFPRLDDPAEIEEFAEAAVQWVSDVAREDDELSDMDVSDLIASVFLGVSVTLPIGFVFLFDDLRAAMLLYALMHNYPQKLADAAKRGKNDVTVILTETDLFEFGVGTLKQTMPALAELVSKDLVDFSIKPGKSDNAEIAITMHQEEMANIAYTSVVNFLFMITRSE